MDVGYCYISGYLLETANGQLLTDGSSLLYQSILNGCAFERNC